MPPPAANRPTDDELRRLYVDERWTAQRIADLAGVRKITALRWLKAAGIERRAPGIGLAARGIAPPTAAELTEMVHIRHSSYDEIAAQYGVDRTAVAHWLDKHGIERPTVWGTRYRGRKPPLPPADEAVARYEAGESATHIAEACGVTPHRMREFLRSSGIALRRDGWQGGRRFQCDDGHEARSVYEQRVDNWLHNHGVEHSTEPAYPWDRRYRADFLANGTYIEVWGVTNNQAYLDRRAMKIERCSDADLDLVQINFWQFAEGRKWWRPLERLVTREDRQ